MLLQGWVNQYFNTARISNEFAREIKIAVEGDEYNGIIIKCSLNGVPPIEKLGQEKYQEYQEYCRNVSPKDSPVIPYNAVCCSDQLNYSSSTTLNDELTSDQEPQPRSDDSGTFSPQTASGPSSGETTVIQITDYFNIHQEVRPHINSVGAPSPPQSGYLSDLGSDGAVSPPHSGFSDPGSGEMDSAWRVKKETQLQPFCSFQTGGIPLFVPQDNSNKHPLSNWKT